LSTRLPAGLTRTGVRLPIEKEYYRKGGGRVPVLLGSATVEEGRSQFVTVVLDLTERKRTEEGARESERRYREVQMQLAHANRVATMGQLTASIAHEVNQPIAAMTLNAETGLRWLGAESPDLDEARQAFGDIVRDGNRAAAVVQRIRNLSKKAPPRDERVEINGAIREVIELTRSEAMKNGVSAQAELVEGLALVHGDRVQLQQVILNLILNSVEAMSETSEGPRELLITTKKAESGDCSSLCAIRVRGWRRVLSRTSSRPSVRPSRTAWGWGCRSAGRSSKRMADDCGRATMRPAVPSFNSRCPLTQTLHCLSDVRQDRSDPATSTFDLPR
jgi:signal transduction histidine kinase